MFNEMNWNLTVYVCLQHSFMWSKYMYLHLSHFSPSVILELSYFVGLCMVYVQGIKTLNYYNCSNFKEGCPDTNYFSDESYECKWKHVPYLFCIKLMFTLYKNENRNFKSNSFIYYLGSTAVFLRLFWLF